MNPNRDREEQLFDAAREIASAEERAAYLAEACGQDVVLRQRIEEMLGSDRAAREFFDTDQPESASKATLGVTTGIVPLTEKAGTVIGRYKLREKIGEGGCGVVY